LTGFLAEKPLARLRGDLQALGIEGTPKHGEPEDHIAILCEIMAGMCSGALETPAGADRTIFEHHLKPWAARFFADLETAEHARFYRHVGAIGRMLMEIETEALAFAA
jgi:TorA maturation chaperone TorD